MDRARAAHLPYCAPGQLTIPLLTRWMLMFTDPQDDTLWWARATPRDWLLPGRSIRVTGAPVSFGATTEVITLPAYPSAFTISAHYQQTS